MVKLSQCLICAISSLSDVSINMNTAALWGKRVHQVGISENVIFALSDTGEWLFAACVFVVLCGFIIGLVCVRGVLKSRHPVEAIII